MDGFGGDNFDQADVDPAAEFLAREKDQLAGLVDDVIPPASDGTGEDATTNSGEHVERCTKYYLIFVDTHYPFISNSFVSLFS